VAAGELEASWARTTAHLEAAIQSLPESTGSGVDDVEHYLQANELGLAFDVLAEVGAQQSAKGAFWKCLERAADEMKLEVGEVPHAESYANVEARLNRPDLYPCPSCGYLVFDEEPGSYSICPVCGWEDDLSQLRFVTMGGANPPLTEYQKSHTRVTQPSGDIGFERDPAWRPLDMALDQIELPTSGVDYGRTYANDRTGYYYWRRRARAESGSDSGGDP
jgi:rubrerythrin